MTADFIARRRLVIEALRASSSAAVASTSVGERLATPDADVSFGELQIDSLVMMEICIHIEFETGLALSVGDLVAHPTINQLAEHLGTRGGRDAG